MIRLIYSPNWFYGIDILVDLLSVIVLLTISVFALRFLKFSTKKHNQIILGFSFILVGLSFISKVFSNLIIYRFLPLSQNFGLALFSSGIFYNIGMFFHRSLMLIGLYLLYSVYSKQSKGSMLLVIYFILISSYFSWSTYYIFHLTALLLLILITRNYFLNRNILMRISFMLITLSQCVFIFSVHELFYVIAEIIQFFGYLTLLLTFIRVLRDGKKTGKK